MRLKRETALVLSKVTNAEVASTIEAIFTSQEALDRYFINHELSRKHHRGTDGGIYPKFNIKQYKLYSLEEVKRGRSRMLLIKRLK